VDECKPLVDGKSVILGKNRVFQFDEVFDPAVEQSTLYSDFVAPLVESCFNGYNATVLAYGQTGSGKTYTMGSGNSVGRCKLKRLEPRFESAWLQCLKAAHETKT